MRSMVTNNAQLGVTGHSLTCKPHVKTKTTFPRRLVNMITSSNENIFRVTSLLWGESIDHRWIPLTKVSDAEHWYFLRSVPVQTVEQTIEAQVIWDAIALTIKSLMNMYQFIQIAWTILLPSGIGSLRLYELDFGCIICLFIICKSLLSRCRSHVRTSIQNCNWCAVVDKLYNH